MRDRRHVAPDQRRTGRGTALLDALLPLARGQAYTSALLVVPAGSPHGVAFAQSKGTALSHKEHFLVLGDTPTTPEDPATVLRLATQADVPALQEIVAAAFGEEKRELPLDRVGDTTYVIARDGVTFGHIRLSVHGDWGGVYGFAVDPSQQGKGIGRDVLARVSRMMRDAGQSRVTLEVETENDSALHLYTSTGFVREAGEEYWGLAL